MAHGGLYGNGQAAPAAPALPSGGDSACPDAFGPKGKGSGLDFPGQRVVPVRYVGFSDERVVPVRCVGFPDELFCTARRFVSVRRVGAGWAGRPRRQGGWLPSRNGGERRSGAGRQARAQRKRQNGGGPRRGRGSHPGFPSVRPHVR